MRRKDILEGPLKNFQQDIAKGYQATQKGGWLAPDSLEKGIQKFFTQVDEPDKDKDKEAAKGGAGTKDSVTKADAKKLKGDGEGILNQMAAKRKYSKELAGYKNSKADRTPPQDARLIGADGKLYHWSGNKWLVRNDTNGRYEVTKDQESIKASWIDAAAKGKTTYIKEETMSKAIKEGLADLADMAERDHEVQMARADLYKIAKYAIKLHDMMKNVSEAEGLEGWQQAKITKAADYIGSVYHNLEYDLKFADGGEMPADALAGISESKKDTHCSDKCCGAEVKREDCKCPPTCKHCNCNAVSEGLADMAHKTGRVHEDATPKLRKHANNLNKHIPDNKRSEEFVKIMATKYAAKYSIDADDLFDTYVAMFNVHQPQSPFLKNTNEGKSPHKKGTKKYKKHMAAMHAEGVQDTYKLKIAERLNKKLGK